MLIKIHSEAPSSRRSKSHFSGERENMTITYYPELALFSQTLNLSSKTFTVTYSPPDRESKSVELSLEPDLACLESIDVSLHQSASKAYKMSDEVNAWFSSCLGCNVILAYLGPHKRPVLGNLSPNATPKKQSVNQAWLSSITASMPNILASKPKDHAILTFADCAAYLVVTEESLKDVSSRLPDGRDMDITKFRPNVVLSGAGAAYEEDYWGAITISSSSNKENKQETEIILTANCGRCVSINVDYSTGKAAKGEEGSVLKKMMRDRRVDKGNKYSPIFGRYGFLSSASNTQTIALGDEVTVSKVNQARTTFGKGPSVSSDVACLTILQNGLTWEPEHQPVQANEFIRQKFLRCFPSALTTLGQLLPIFLLTAVIPIRILIISTPLLSITLVRFR